VRLKEDVLNDIMSLRGLDSIKETVMEWENVMNNIKIIPENMPIVFPNYLWVAKTGMGITHVTSLISEYLEVVKAIQFAGEVKFIEFILDYTSDKERFPAFSRLVATLKNAAGFRNEFKGVVCIDVSEWVGYQNEKRFIRFLEYLSDNSDYLFLIFIIDGKPSHEMEAVLSSFLRIRKLKLNFPSEEILCEYVKNNIIQYGLMISEDANNILVKTLEKLIVQNGFDGYNTLNQLVLDLLYDKCKAEESYNKIIDEKDIERYAPDGEWISQMLFKENIKRSIGFMINTDVEEM
jgi:hypothetical protein